MPLLIECTADSNDGLRMNAAMALGSAPASAVDGVMRHLIADPNSRVRLIAAGRIARRIDIANEPARAVLIEALEDAALRVRRSALELVDSLGAGAAPFLESLVKRSESESDPELLEIANGLVQRLRPAPPIESPALEPSQAQG